VRLDRDAAHHAVRMLRESQVVRWNAAGTSLVLNRAASS
jgi:hypothetical protein